MTTVNFQANRKTTPNEIDDERRLFYRRLKQSTGSKITPSRVTMGERIVSS